MATATVAQADVPIRQVPRLVAEALGTPPIDAATARRWVRGGVGGIRLWAVKRGARLFTSREVVLTFLRTLNEAGRAG